MKMTTGFLALALAPALMVAGSKADAVKRIQASTDVFTEIMSAPDKGIPAEILDKAQCVGIIPDLKRAGLILGAKYGKGFLTCRAGDSWSALSSVRVEGGSFGLQIGAGETDLVFVVMNKRGEDKLLKDKFTFGADASAMAGPVGRSAEAQTDAMMHAEILSYSRSRGVFAGIALDGSTMRPDNEDNEAIYGRPVTHREVLTGSVAPPAAAESLYGALNRYTHGHSAQR